MRVFTGSKLKFRLARLVHGPSQVLRPASAPSWLLRHSFAAFDPLASSDCMPEATAGSAAVAGVKTKARSLNERPSPLTSPETIGVKGAPEMNCWFQLKFSTPKNK